MAESTLSRYITKGLRALGAHVVRHEDIASSGVPDISYGLDGCNGWIELKEIKEWKKRSATPNDIGLSPEQRLWLRQRGKTGGRCFVLVRVTASREYYLFDWHIAPKTGDLKLTHAEMDAEAVNYWRKGISFTELATILTYKGGQSPQRR